MARISLWTYQDAIDHLIDYDGAASDASTERFARRAVQDAMNSIWDERNWSYFQQRGRINTVAPYSTGTVEFDATGGSSERLITLTSGTLPTWAGDGTMTISDIPYDIFTRLSGTTAQMATYSNPGVDIASGTSYTLYRDTYTLPIGFGSMGRLVNMTQSCVMSRVTHDQMISAQRLNSLPGQPYLYSITSDPRRLGVLAIRLFPAPDAVYALDYSYRRSPRELSTILYSTGTVSVTSGTTTLTGSGTAWTSKMIGAIVRLSDNATNVPTGLSGQSPCSMERVVSNVVSATEITLDSAASATYSGVKHSISDPIDIEHGAMLNYLLRAMEKAMRAIRRIKPLPFEDGMYSEAKIMAYEADSRGYEDRASRMNGPFRTRMADMPTGEDVV